MKLPRIKAEMSLPEVSAFARLRAAFLLDLGENLPAAMRARTADRVSKGTLKEDLREALAEAKAKGLDGEDALVLAVGSLLLGEAREVSTTLRDEHARQWASSEKADAAVEMCLAPGVVDAPG